MRLRFDAVTTEEGGGPGGIEQAVFVRIEDIGGHKLGAVLWFAGKPIDELFRAIAAELQRVGEYPGVERFDAGAVMEGFLQTLKLAINARTGRAGALLADLPPLVELPNDEWAVTTAGVDSLTQYYQVTRDRLNEAWPSHISEKPWANVEKFEEAFTIAQVLYPRQSTYEPTPRGLV